MSGSEKKGAWGVRLLGLLDGEISLAAGKVDFNNDWERNQFLYRVVDSLAEFDFIELRDGTRFDKTFTPKDKRGQK